MNAVSGSRQIVFIADDFGASARANVAICRAHREGVLTGASLMLGQSGMDEAIRMAAALPDLEIGWHLHVCDSRPMTCPRWPWGRSPFAAAVSLTVSPSARRLVRGELSAQWAAFQRSGLRCRFINGHHHLHLHPAVGRILEELVAGIPGIWIRSGRFRRFGSKEGFVPKVTRVLGTLRGTLWRSPGSLRNPDSIWGVDRLHAMEASEVARAVERLPLGLHEFIFHPGDASDGGLDRDLESLIRLKSLLRAS